VSTSTSIGRSCAAQFRTEIIGKVGSASLVTRDSYHQIVGLLFGQSARIDATAFEEHERSFNPCSLIAVENKPDSPPDEAHRQRRFRARRRRRSDKRSALTRWPTPVHFRHDSVKPAEPVDLIVVNRVNAFAGQKSRPSAGFISRGDETSLRDLWIPCGSAS
jgi:hypothetical protein